MTMGERVVTATRPLSDEDRAKFRMLAADSPVDARPTPYNASATDAAPFDSVPGAGFDTNPMAAAIVPPRGTLTGAGAHLSISPQEINAFRGAQPAWKPARRLAVAAIATSSAVSPRA